MCKVTSAWFTRLCWRLFGLQCMSFFPLAPCEMKRFVTLISSLLFKLRNSRKHMRQRYQKRALARSKVEQTQQKRKRKQKIKRVQLGEHKTPFDFVDRKRCHACYLAWSTKSKRPFAYVGYSIKPHRRIRQHSGELKGGAKKAKPFAGKGRWREPDENIRLLAVVARFMNKRDAMKFEYAWQSACKRNAKAGLEFIVPALSDPVRKWTQHPETIPVGDAKRQAIQDKFCVFWFRDLPTRGFDPRSLSPSPLIEHVFDCTISDLEAHWHFVGC